MRTVETVSELRAVLAPDRREGRSIGLVPTMGAFHAGHVSLIRRAREQCDVVVVSLFVNPAQFNESTDLAAYPRDPEGDAATAAAEGVDYLFAPAVTEVYPSGFSTTISVDGPTARLEGASRGQSHFDGVTTVVAKLFNMVGPDVAYFGQKDAQQAIVVRRMARDLNLPVRIEVCPTVRAPDGLALSSRNALLGAEDRERAAALHRALDEVARAVQAQDDLEAALSAGHAELARAGLEAEYLELVSPETLEPATTLEGHLLAVIAARVGPVRLIDNALITIRPPAAAASPSSRELDAMRGSL